MSDSREIVRDRQSLDKRAIEAAYARWAPVYDLMFATLLRPGRRAVASIASRADGRILDVGVGTGLELPLFQRGTRVFGVDLSEPMLRRAASRVASERLTHVAGLARMDATRLAFADGSFACVVAPYMLTVVPNPQATLDELARVLRPGGEIVLVNHISSQDTALSAAESWLGAYFSSMLGWRPQFSWSIIGDWIDARADMRLIERRLVAPLGLFTLTRIERVASSAASGQDPSLAAGKTIVHAGG